MLFYYVSFFLSYKNPDTAAGNSGRRTDEKPPGAASALLYGRFAGWGKKTSDFAGFKTAAVLSERRSAESVRGTRLCLSCFSILSRRFRQKRWTADQKQISERTAAALKGGLTDASGTV